MGLVARLLAAALVPMRFVRRHEDALAETEVHLVAQGAPPNRARGPGTAKSLCNRARRPGAAHKPRKRARGPGAVQKPCKRARGPGTVK